MGNPKQQVVGAVRSLARKPVVVRARVWARTRRDERDAVPVRQARALVKALREDPPDVVYLGDSCAAWVHPDDADQRMLATMIEDALAPLKVVAIHGGGYNAPLHTAYLRLLESSPHRPLVVHSMWDRGCAVPWAYHPIHSHQHTIDAVAAVDPTGPLRRIRRRRIEPKAAPADWEAFAARPYETAVHGPGTIGDLMTPLRDASRWAPDDEERLALLHAYHYSARYDTDAAEPGRFRELGRTIRELGCRSVAYQNPVPTELCRRLLGAEVVELMHRNLDVTAAAYLEGAGGAASLVRIATEFREDEFIDLTDGCEHVKEDARRRIAAEVADRVRAVLAEPRPGTPA